MIINIINGNDSVRTIEYSEQKSLAEIAAECCSDDGYRSYAALVDNETMPLSHIVSGDCSIRFLDIRDKATANIYQGSLLLLLFKAINDLTSDETAEVRMTINAGIFIALRSRDLSENEVRDIESRMREMVDQDLPITSNGFDYTIDGFTLRLYNYLVPSTGYLDIFSLMKYRDGLLLRYPQSDDPRSIPEFTDDAMMYDAYKEQSRWNELLGVRYITDINEKIRSGGAKEMIQLSEALHDQKVVDIANMIKEEKKRIILILGPSSSGKTTTAKRLAIQLKVNGLDPFYVSTDDYFVERDETPKDAEGNYNFEGIDAIDVELFNDNMNALLAGEEVDVPEFDFIEGTKRFGNRMTRLEPNQPIIIEGIHAFNHSLTGRIPDDEKFKIYISPLTHINMDRCNRIPSTAARIIRRMVRDAKTRNYDAVMTMRNWPKVHQGEMDNIFPYANEADVFFNSVHVFETAVLKKHAVPLLEAVPTDAPEHSEAIRLLRFFDTIVDIEDESLIAVDSILREFIGGGIYEQ